MKTSFVPYQGDQLEIDFDLDRPQLSICPQCSSDIIRLADGCRVCGWREKQSVESSISIPGSVQQPEQPELMGDRCIVYISDSNSIATIYKLLVYPSFSGVGHIEQCSSKQSPPSKIRRQKGEGSGAVFYRIVTRNGRDYQQAYYHWRDFNGKQRTKYIPVKLLDKVCQAEFRKQPVEDILLLLGCIEKCSSKIYGTLDKCSSKRIHPSKKRRVKGHGTAYIECKPITKNGKQYKQYWFHWQIWREGETVMKKSRYIPKRLVPKIERMNNEKAPVEKILKVLESKSKRRK